MSLAPEASHPQPDNRQKAAGKQSASTKAVEEFRQILLWPLALVRRPNEETAKIAVEAARHVTSDPNWEPVRDHLLYIDEDCDPGSFKPEGKEGPKPYSYQEFVYFHDFVSRFLYDREDTSRRSGAPGFFLFAHKLVRGVEVTLNLGDQATRVALRVVRCHLYIFRTGIALLVMEVTTAGAGGETSRSWSLDDVLDFSDVFRRVYTPWFEAAKDKRAGFEPKAVAQDVTWHFEGGTSKQFRPRALEDEWAQLLADGNRSTSAFDAPVAPQWAELLPSAFAVAGDAAREPNARVILRHVLDERMAVMSFVCLAGEISVLDESDWARLCFVDPRGKGLPYAAEFLSDFDVKHAYDRFRHNGTRHLFSSYSYVLVTSGDWARRTLGEHFRRMYFQMCLLAYHELAMYVAFSGRVAAAINRADDLGRVDAPEFRSEILQAQRDFLDFVHRFRFTSLSNQVQAIELYAMFRKQLRLQEIFVDVSTELETATTYLRAAESAEQSASAESLNVVAAIGVTLGLSVSMLSAWPPLVPDNKVSWPLVAGTFLGFSIAALGLTAGAGSMNQQGASAARIVQASPARFGSDGYRFALCPCCLNGPYGTREAMIDCAATFFLGGRDLEMEEIARVLGEAGMAYLDRGLAWGARISDYEAEIAETVMLGRHAYAVELKDDMPASWPSRRGLRIIDHHGGLAGEDRPTSLEQILDLLAISSGSRSRWRQLVSANDKGHIAGLAAIGADANEIAEVRRADRLAQKVTAEDEAIALAAIERRRIDGRLTRVDVDLPSATAVTDFISPELGGPGADRLLVITPRKLAVFADGDVIRALARAVERSWWGGMLPGSGFWGAENKGDILPTVSAVLAATP